MPQKTKVTIVILVVFAAIVVLAGANLRENTVYYYTVKEYLDKPELFDRHVQVKGNVVEGSLKYDATTLDLRFVLEDGGKRLAVYHHGVKPDTLTDHPQAETGKGIEVVAAGKMGPDNVFQAKQLIVKCPSRYIDKNKAAASGDNGASTATTGPNMTGTGGNSR